MLKGLFILTEKNFEITYGPQEIKDIKKYVDINERSMTKAEIRKDLSVLKSVEVIFSGWGGPRMDSEFLEAAPNLQCVFYGSGSIKGKVTDEFWEKEITICSSWAANAVPVAEYTLAQILFSLKRGWYFAFEVKKENRFLLKKNISGAYGSTVGIISLGMIGRKVCEFLKDFDVKVIAYDPYISSEKAAKLNVELCELDEVFRQAEVVSLHAPLLPETEGMITGEHFKLMKENATFINTARGAVVNEPEMIAVLQERSDIYAVLDVTYPEPPAADSPLYDLLNVVLTPHIAGSIGRECRRMGRYMVNELERYVAGQPLKWSITREQIKIMA